MRPPAYLLVFAALTWACCGTESNSRLRESYAQLGETGSTPIETGSTPIGTGSSQEAPQPRQRPGLATSWGEARPSQVHEVAFHRAAHLPFATGSVFYNDRDGVEAMASYDVRQAARLAAPVPVQGGITLSVVDEEGVPLQALALGGHIYVTGESGRHYSVVISNLTDRRYEAVLSVDGLDVMDGDTASVQKRGYLIAPHSSFTVEGFRKSYDEVAAFRFGSVSRSYAAKTGSDRNVGVIGYAFFNERGSTLPDEVALRRSADAFSGDRFAVPPDGE